MRKTYRQTSVHKYWENRWSAVPIDEPMKNTSVYPLNSSLLALHYGNWDKHDIRILEAGCGLGRIVRFFHDRDYEIKGVDFSENAIGKIKTDHPDLDVSVENVLALNVRDEIFTHVLAFGLYHNFEESDLTRAINETHRILKTNGILCASFRADNINNLLLDKFLNSPLGRHGHRTGNDNTLKIFHKINLSEKELRIIFEDNGFEVLEIKSVVNMPLLYKFSMFRHKEQKEFDEKESRNVGYKLNLVGRMLFNFMFGIAPKHFCNLYCVVARKT